MSLTTENSFILYSELLTGDDVVDCIYFASNQCRAQPSVQIGRGGDRDYYRPTEEEQTRYCKTESKFNTCLRFQAYQDDLKARGLEKVGEGCH